MRIDSKIVGKKVIVGETVIESNYYKEGDIFTVKKYIEKDDVKLFHDVVILDNGHALLDLEIKEILGE